MTTRGSVHILGASGSGSDPNISCSSSDSFDRTVAGGCGTTDTFSRNVYGSWGTADSGEVWVNQMSGVGVAVYSVQGTYGVADGTQSPGGVDYALSGMPSGQMELRTSFTLDVLPGNGSYDDVHFYRSVAHESPFSGVRLRIFPSSSVGTLYAEPAAYGGDSVENVTVSIFVGDTVYLHVLWDYQGIPGRVAGKVWKEGQSEPANWMVYAGVSHTYTRNPDTLCVYIGYTTRVFRLFDIDVPGANACSTGITDTFTRVIASTSPPGIPTLGTSDATIPWEDGIWQDIFLEASSVEVDGSKAIIDLYNNDVANFMLPIPSSSSLDVTMLGSIESTASWGSSWGIVARSSIGGQYENVLLSLVSNSETILYGSGYTGPVTAGQAWISTPDGGFGFSTTPVTVLAGSFTSDRFFRVRLEITPTGSRAKIWWADLDEPNSWQVDATSKPPGFLPDRFGTFMYSENDHTVFMMDSIDISGVKGLRPTSSSGLGSSSIGGNSWHVIPDTASNTYCDGNNAIWDLSPIRAATSGSYQNSMRYLEIPGSVTLPYEMQTRFKLHMPSPAPTFNYSDINMYFGLSYAAPAVDGWPSGQAVGVRLDAGTGSTPALSCTVMDTRTGSTVEDSETTSLAWPWLDEFLLVRIRIESGGTYARIWRSGDTEPTTWSTYKKWAGSASSPPATSYVFIEFANVGYPSVTPGPTATLDYVCLA